MNEKLYELKRYYLNHILDLIKDENISYQISLIDEFKREYSIDKIASMTLEEYALGTDNFKTSFCYQLEFGKYRSVGLGIGGATAAKFGIYKKSDGNYYGRNNKIIDNPELFFLQFRNQLCSYLRDVDVAGTMFNACDKYPLLQGVSMMLVKLSSIYYPDKFLNIGSHHDLVTIVKSFSFNLNIHDSSEKLSFDIKSQFDKFIPEMKKYHSHYLSYILYDFLEDQNVMDCDGKQTYWLYAPGENACVWDECLQNQVMLLGWDKIGDYSQYVDKSDVYASLKQEYGYDNPTNSALAIDNFCHHMKIGDIVIVKKGIKTILGYGVVTSDYYYDSSYREYQNVRKVDWKKVGEWNIEDSGEDRVNKKTLTDITSYTTYVNHIMNLINDSSQDNHVQYFWLNANPKIWKFSNIQTGETIEYTAINDNGNKRRIYQNYLNAKKGDKIIAYESTPVKAVVGLCEVEKELTNHVLLIKKVEQLLNPIPYSEISSQPELENMEFFKNAQGSLFKLEKNEFEIIYDMIRENNPLTMESFDSYSVDDFYKDVYISRDKYNEIVTLLKRKKNIILQGAPGVGKTYMAKKLAYSMIGEKNKNRVTMIQFHQSYSYEDFIEGYRPNENGFSLEKGIFYQICQKAGNDPSHDYYLIIDEINRGNLSKIFGELLMLIEHDKRGESLLLAYSKTLFSVPKNLYIIGMMNTADRSIAIMDYALRRRFSFVDIFPAFENDTFKKYQESLNNVYFNSVIDKICLLNKEIKEDALLGEGFMIGHSYFCDLQDVSKEQIDSIIKYDIIPMLKEYWFDNSSKVEEWKIRLLGE